MAEPRIAAGFVSLEYPQQQAYSNTIEQMRSLLASLHDRFDPTMAAQIAVNALVAAGDEPMCDAVAFWTEATAGEDPRDLVNLVNSRPLFAHIKPSD